MTGTADPQNAARRDGHRSPDDTNLPSGSDNSRLGADVFDLRPATALCPNLEELHLTQGSLANLEGIEAWSGSLRRLELSYLRNLTSLEGLERATSLRSLELAKLTKVHNLEKIRDLPWLRFLQVDLTNLATLAPLAGHPGLEMFNTVSMKVRGATPLLDVPNLRGCHLTVPLCKSLTNAGGEIPHFRDAPGLVEDLLEYRWM